MSDNTRLDDRLDGIEEALRLLATEKTTAASLGEWRLLPQTIFNGIMIILTAAGIVALVQQAGMVQSMQTEVRGTIKTLDSLNDRVDKEVEKGRIAIEKGERTSADETALRGEVEELIHKFDLQEYLRDRNQPPLEPKR